MISRSGFARKLAILAISLPIALQAQTAGPALARSVFAINGTVDGSLQVMSGTTLTFNTGANLSGDLRVPGTPTITLKTPLTYGGTVVGTGSSSPLGYAITVNKNSTLGHIVTRTDPVTLPTVGAPPAPTGTRSVTITSSTGSPGTFSTLLNLTLNSGVGQFAIPAGTYGSFTANTGSGFTLGVAGASTPSVYNFQALALNSGSQLQVLGPVVITLASGIAINGNVGASGNLSWLTLNVYSGNVTLNSSWSIYGTLNAPKSGSLVTLKTGSQLIGSLVCDQLSVEAGGLLRLSSVAVLPNIPPTVSLTAPTNNSIYGAPASIALQATAADSDGAVSKVEFFNGTTLLGQSTAAPYQYSWTNVAVGNYSLTARATDNSGATATSSAVNVSVINPPDITSASNASGQVGSAFSYQITASNSPTSFGATGLPDGLSVDASTGIISGTPISVGTSTVTISATKSGVMGSATLTVIVNPPNPVITSATTAGGQIGAPFSYQITATNAPASYDATGLPAGLSVNSATGVISGTPTVPGTGSVTISATNSGGTGTATLSLTITSATPVITSAPAANGVVGVAFTYQITASNNPTGFSASGLPPGLNIDSMTGLLSGTPTTTGTSSVTLGATNFGGTGTATLTLTISSGVPVITSPTTASGQVGITFSYQIAATNNPTSFSATGLPAGLSVNATTGLISGTPTAAGTNSVTLGASNSSGTGNATLTVTVSPAVPVITSPTTAGGQVDVAFSYQITASNSPTSYRATGLPAGLSIDTATGLISGTPTAAATSSVTLGAANSAGTGTAILTLMVGGPTSVITSPATASGQTGSAFSFQVGATNNPTGFSATGLPPGLTIDPVTGLISGTPTRPGVSTVVVTVTNANGTVTTTITLTILASLPYSTDFELSEGYTEGDLGAQLGWVVPQGDATVTSADQFTGAMSALLSPATPPTILTQIFAPVSGEGIVFVDFFAKPVARPSAAQSTLFSAEQTKFALQQSGTQGILYSYSGDGNGGGVWTPTTFAAPLDANNRTVSWTRLTVHADFSRQIWDLYANGQMVAAGLKFLGASTYFSAFQVQGDASTASGVDDFYAGETNPLFADINNNGIDDAWELAHGLSLSADNRDVSPTGNGVTVVQAYVGGTDPNDFYNGTAPTLTIVGGNNQVSPSGQFNPLPLEVEVRSSTGTTLLTNAPVTFTVASGGGQLTANGPSDVLKLTTLSRVTDANGRARAYYQQPPFALKQSTITVGAGPSQQTFTSNSSAIVILVAGGDSNLWQDANGVTRLWGADNFGQLGDGTTQSRPQMSQILGVTEPLVAASLGQAHGLAATETGKVYAWGDNYFGQLGVAASAAVSIPVLVTGATNVVDVAVGDGHSLALCGDGTVWSWGENQSGQLGDGTTINRSTPTQIAGLSGVVKIVAGARHSAALTADGTVWVWGSNEFGQLATSSISQVSTPTVVAGLRQVLALASGRQHLLVRCVDGTVWSWGNNHAGQLGIGSTTGQVAPQQIAPTTPAIVSFAAGSGHSIALCADGTLLAWGANSVGQLGNGTALSSAAPVALALVNVKLIAAGSDHVVVLLGDGSLQSWGLNRSGQLGTQTLTDFSNVPVSVSPPEAGP